MKKVVFAIAVSAIMFGQKSFAQNDEAAKKAMTAENFNTAKNIYRTILQGNDKEPKNYFNFGEALFANNQFDSAKLMYQAGLAINQRSLPNLVGMGKCLLNEGKKDEAKKSFDKALDLASSKDVNTSILVAQAYIASEKFSNPDAAIDLLNSKKEANDKNASLYETLGDAYNLKNDGGNAVSNYQFAVQNNPNSVSSLTKIGEIYVRAKNYDEAIKNFNDALAIDASFPLAHRELSDLYFRAGKFDKAKTEFDEFTKNAEPTIDTKIRSAKILYKNERYDDAIAAMNEVLKVQPNNYIMYRLLAYSFTKKEKMSDAETYFQKYFQLVPQKELIATDYSNYAKVLNAGGKDSLAIVSYKKAMEIDNSFDFNADILISYFKQKKYSQVTTEFENIIAKNSNIKDPNIYYNAARSYYYQDKFKAADSAYAIVNKLSPKYAGGWWGRVRCNLRMDSTNVNYAAKPFYDKYLEVAKLDDPKNKSNVIEAYHYLADFSFTKEGDKDKAKDYCEKILALDPDDQQAKDVLKGLAEKKK